MKKQIAVLDDYQNVAFRFADWSVVQEKASVTVFNDHVDDEAELIKRLHPFQIVCVMRERTPLTRHILSKLPNLKLVVSTGMRNASIDMKAAADLGITISPTGYYSGGAPELTWALLMALTKHVVDESLSVRSGGWQKNIGGDLKGKTIGIVGLGNIGSRIAHYAKAFEMEIIAWSENLTSEKANAQGARLVSKEELFSLADFVTIHLVLSERTKRLIQARELNWMKRTTFIINTSRGPIIDEEALIRHLQDRKIAGAALDVFSHEPLPPEHPFRNMDNVLITPHIGYVTENTYRVFFGDTVKAIIAWLK